jgi:hypothetical protein
VRTRSVSTTDFAERIVLWTVIVLATVATITRMIRRRRFEPLGLTKLRLRRNPTPGPPPDVRDSRGPVGV